VHGPEGNHLRDQLARWAASVGGIGEGYPPMPDGVVDRAADVWEPLLAVADAAGGPWPECVRVAAVALVALSMAGTPSLGIRLLEDLRQVFGDREAVTTNEILETLAGMDEAPWGDLRGGPINARRLAALLRPYGVKRCQVRIGNWTGKGYRAEDLRDAWSRYLGPPAMEPETSETRAAANDDANGATTP